MQKIMTDNIWHQIATLAKKSSKKLAALAYVSSSEFVSFKKGDILICDASEQAIRSGETSATVLSKFYNAGAQIYSCPYLHAKVLICDKNVLIGSCNLSLSSAQVLRELAVLTTDSSTRSQVVAYIHAIKDSSFPIDETILEKLLKIPVVKRKGIRGVKRPPINLGNRTWIISTYDLNPDRYKHEETFVEKAEKEVRKKIQDSEADISWCRWTGKNAFRSLAREGDTIIEMNSDRNSNRTTVSAPAAILKRQDYDKWTRFYYETQETTLAWTKFERELRKVGLTQIKKNSTKEIKPRDAALINTIWDK